MAARLEDGWLRVPYTGPELTVIEIGLGEDYWQAAFLDWDAAGQRVAQIRPPAGLSGAVQVRVRAAGMTADHGMISLGEGGPGQSGSSSSVQ